MADPIIRLKRSAVFGKIPTADQLPLGEVALNTYDGYLYASKNVGIGTTVIAINPFRVGTGTDSYNTYFTQGNVGLGLTNPTERLHVSGNVTITGITTFQGNAPSFDVMYLDPETMLPVDLETYVFDLETANKNDKLSWNLFHDNRKDYNLTSLSP